MKTAMQELIGILENNMSAFPDKEQFWGLRSAFMNSIACAKEKLAQERQQIIDARLSVTGLNHASPTDDNSLQEATDYFTQKYEQ